MVNKLKHLSLAELIDAYRIVPRIGLLFTFGLCWRTFEWYMSLPDPTTGQAIVLSSLGGVLTGVIGLYTSTGRKWS